MKQIKKQLVIGIIILSGLTAVSKNEHKLNNKLNELSDSIKIENNVNPLKNLDEQSDTVKFKNPKNRVNEILAVDVEIARTTDSLELLKLREYRTKLLKLHEVFEDWMREHAERQSSR